jgi:hypothetical protein
VESANATERLRREPDDLAELLDEMSIGQTQPLANLPDSRTEIGALEDVDGASNGRVVRVHRIAPLEQPGFGFPRSCLVGRRPREPFKESSTTPFGSTASRCGTGPARTPQMTSTNGAIAGEGAAAKNCASTDPAYRQAAMISPMMVNDTTW